MSASAPTATAPIAPPLPVVTPAVAVAEVVAVAVATGTGAAPPTGGAPGIWSMSVEQTTGRASITAQAVTLIPFAPGSTASRVASTERCRVLPAGRSTVQLADVASIVPPALAAVRS